MYRENVLSQLLNLTPGLQKLGTGSISPATCMQTTGLFTLSKKFLENMMESFS